MYLFWLLALIPIIIGAVIFVKSKEINLLEFGIGTGVCLLLALIFQVISIFTETGDYETISGQIIRVEHHPRWVERYTLHHSETYTTGSGKNQRTHTRHWTTTEYDTHSEHWKGCADFGEFGEICENISEENYSSIGLEFGNKSFTYGKQSADHFGGTKSSGDNNIYAINNETLVTVPAISSKFFRNYIKASPSLFSFSQVPTNINIYPYPENNSFLVSERLIGTAQNLINARKFDEINARLGPKKLVNVILVGFNEKNQDLGQYQQAAWVGGKKNDLVLCFGGANRSHGATWAYVFGWTEKEIVKKNLETILLESPMNEEILPKIEQEIVRNYQIKDWSKFSYISVEPPTWMYIVYFVVMIGTQAGLYIHFHNNEYSKDGISYFKSNYASMATYPKNRFNRFKR